MQFSSNCYLGSIYTFELYSASGQLNTCYSILVLRDEALFYTTVIASVTHL